MPGHQIVIEDTSDLGKMKMWLRNEYRMKDGTDYAIVRRFGETHVLTREMWVDYIRGAADRFDIDITSVSLYIAKMKPTTYPTEENECG